MARADLIAAIADLPPRRGAVREDRFPGCASAPSPMIACWRSTVALAGHLPAMGLGGRRSRRSLAAEFSMASPTPTPRWCREDSS